MPNFNLEQIAKSCGGASRSTGGWLCRCPSHNDRNASLSLSSNGDKLLAKCFAGCSFENIIDALKNMGLLDAGIHSCSNNAIKNAADKKDYALKLWNNSVSAENTLVKTYLHNRAYLGDIPSSLRYHPRLKHAPSSLVYPAMVAGISIYPSSEITAIHRTFLNFDGLSKAPVDNNKRMLGATSGGAVRFGQCAGNSIWVTEGIETGLSVYLATKQPTWATLSTSGMKAVALPPPSIVPNLYIAADNDNSGIKAAEALAAREITLGRTVRIVIPPKQGQDFNDLLRE